jgi:hypothetical protein
MKRVAHNSLTNQRVYVTYSTYGPTQVLPFSEPCFTTQEKLTAVITINYDLPANFPHYIYYSRLNIWRKL